MNSSVIIVGGVPGTGKTTVAEALSEKMGISHFSKDILEAAVVRSGIATRHNLQGVGYELLATLADKELRRGRSVIIDCVASLSRVNDYWERLLTEKIKYIECVCSNPHLHESRISSRRRGISGWYELTWKDVEGIKERYQPFSESRLVLDSADNIEGNIAKALEYVHA